MSISHLPMERCLFAELTVPSKRGRMGKQELLYEFEAFSPIPIEQLHVVFTHHEGCVIGCACSRDELVKYQNSAEMLVPAGLPEWLGTNGDSAAICSRLNLLTGNFQPESQRIMARRTSIMACIVLLGAAFLFLSASLRRAEALADSSAEIGLRIDAMYKSVLPPPQEGVLQPSSIRFQTLLNELSTTRTRDGSEQHSPLIPRLASVIASWDSESKARVRSLTIAETELRVVAGLENNQRALAIVEHLRHSVDWSIQSHSVTPRRDQVDLNVLLKPAKLTGDMDE